MQDATGSFNVDAKLNHIRTILLLLNQKAINPY